MDSFSRHVVSLQRATPRTMAAVRARLAPHRVPDEFSRYLDQVYAARASGLQLDGQNIFLYNDVADGSGHLVIDFGVGITVPMTPTGLVRAVELPVGDVAATTHRGAYSGLAAAHTAVVDWCRAHSRALAGPRWEVYGHWAEGEVPQTDIYYLLRPAGSASSA